MYSIQSFDRCDKLFDLFISFPGELYRNDTYYAEEAHIPEDSAFEYRYFIVFKGESVCGRAAAVINQGIRYCDNKTGLIGYYECLDDMAAATLLFSHVKRFLKERACSYGIGPLNGSTWHKYRVTEPDNYPPFFLDNYHKPWYSRQFAANSFQPIASYNSSRISKLSVSPDRVKRFEEIFAQKGITIRSIRPTMYEEDVRKIYVLCIEAFRDNFLYTPLSSNEMIRLYKRAEKYIDPDYVLLCENRENRPLAFIFCVPNLYEKNRKSLVIKTVAVIPDIRVRGLGSLLVEKIHATAFQNGYHEIIHALMYESNISNKIAADNSEVFRTYTLYGKTL